MKNNKEKKQYKSFKNETNVFDNLCLLINKQIILLWHNFI